MKQRIDIADHLLGELSGDELAEAERLMSEDPAFRAEVERLRPAVTHLEALPAEAWDRPDPPPLDLHGAGAESETAAREPARLAPRRWWRGRLTMPRLGVALASMALLVVGLGGGLLLAGDEPLEPAQTLALEPVGPQGEGASGSALVGASGSEVEVDISGAPLDDPDEFYELWLLDSPDDLISLGSFRVDENGSAKVRVPLPVDPSQFQFIDLSIERDDGDSSHSGRSILRATT